MIQKLLRDNISLRKVDVVRFHNFDVLVESEDEGEVGGVADVGRSICADAVLGTAPQPPVEGGHVVEVPEEGVNTLVLGGLSSPVAVGAAENVVGHDLGEVHAGVGGVVGVSMGVEFLDLDGVLEAEIRDEDAVDFEGAHGLGTDAVDEGE